MACLAVNAAVRDKPAKEKLEFFGNSFFIPIFFIVTGFLIDPVAFFQSITTNFPLAAAVVLALLVGKWAAAQTVGLAFAYTPVLTEHFAPRLLKETVPPVWGTGTDRLVGVLAYTVQLEKNKDRRIDQRVAQRRLHEP
jgi:hypothetical protein